MTIYTEFDKQIPSAYPCFLSSVLGKLTEFWSIKIHYLFDLILYVHSTIFQLCGTGLPGLNQY